MTTIKDVPMVTVDQVEIRLNSILYKAEWSSGYGFDREGKARVEAYRVISIDNSHRHFRLRCMNGCETSYSFEKSCARLFGRLPAAKRELARLAANDVKKCDKKLSEVLQTKKHILKELRRARATCPTSRKPVKELKPSKVSR